MRWSVAAWLVTSSILLVACPVPERYMMARTAGQTDCQPAEIVIVSNTKNDGSGNFSWIAECRSRSYKCSQTNLGNSRMFVRCDETIGSTERTTAKMAIDRLVLETECNNVRIEKGSSFSKAGRRSYRLWACGRRYVCSPTNDISGMDCELAEVQEVDSQAPSKNTSVLENSGRVIITERSAPHQPVGEAEGHAVLKGVEPELSQCIHGAPSDVTIELQINGDGSCIYLGSTPPLKAEMSSCIRQLINTVRFRETNAEPIKGSFVVPMP